ncbi:MAG: SDR family oxidoreductase, partial [Phaeodactylibacter sp.]|nr:SDR family oxidoreductase [Phaeodactylibacter sp.]
DFQQDFEINVLGAVKVLKAARKALVKAGNASVVLYSTVAVGQGMPFHASVAASKGAVEGLARSLAAEWAPKVRVNCIAPSLTDTPLAAGLLSNAAKREASDKRHPLRRVGQPEDIAAMTTFLLSDKGNWISGQVLGVDGGMATLRV